MHILFSKYTIPFFSFEWIITNTITLLSIILLITFLKRSKKSFIYSFTKYFAFFLFFEYILMWLIAQDSWTFIESMPFHLCNLMWFNSIYLLLTKKQWSFEMMLFIGMPAAFHSLLTPQLNHGNEFINVFDFFFGHGWLFACCFYCIFVLGMKPRVKSWWYSFLRLQDIIAFVFLANFTINYFSFGYIIPPDLDYPTSNYMYLLAPPLAENPFVIGAWPSYLLGLLFATFLHSFVIYIPFHLKKYFLKV